VVHQEAARCSFRRANLLVIGGGGTSSHDDVYGADTVGSDPIYGGDPVAQVYLDTPADKVYKAVATGSEIATWSAVRDPDPVHPWGMATFDLDPGARPGGQTTLTINFYHTPAATTSQPNPAPVIFDTFTMSKSRRDRGFPGSRFQQGALASR
jgi:hypothetical protein